MVVVIIDDNEVRDVTEMMILILVRDVRFEKFKSESVITNVVDGGQKVFERGKNELPTFDDLFLSSEETALLCIGFSLP